MLKTAYAHGVAAARRKLAAHDPGEDHPYVAQHKADVVAENAAGMAIPLGALGMMGGGALGSAVGGGGGMLLGAMLGGGLGGYGGYRLGETMGEGIHNSAVHDILRSPQSARRAVEGGLGADAYSRVALRSLMGAGRAYNMDDEDAGTRALLRGGVHGAAALIQEQQRLERKRRLVEALVGLEERRRTAEA